MSSANVSFVKRLFRALRRRLIGQYGRTREFWENRGATYHQRALSPAYEKMYTDLVDLVMAPKPGKVLEFGCGDAVLLRRLQNAGFKGQLFGCDYAGSQVEKAKTLVSGCTFSVQDIQSTNFADKEFDVAICIGVIMYLNEAQFQCAASELRRIAHRVIIAEMDSRWMTPERRQAYLAVPYHNQHDIARTLTTAGFTVTEDRRLDYFWDDALNPDHENGYNLTIAQA